MTSPWKKSVGFTESMILAPSVLVPSAPQQLKAAQGGGVWHNDLSVPWNHLETGGIRHSWPSALLF